MIIGMVKGLSRSINTGGEQIKKKISKMSGVQSGVYQNLKQQQLGLER